MQRTIEALKNDDKKLIQNDNNYNDKKMGEKGLVGPLTGNSLIRPSVKEYIAYIKIHVIFRTQESLIWTLSYEKGDLETEKAFIDYLVETMKERNLSSLEVTRAFKDEHRLKIKICNSNYSPVQKESIITSNYRPNSKRRIF